MDPISVGIAGAAALFKGISGFFSHNAEAKAEKVAARQAQAEAGVAASQALGQGDAVAAQGAVNAAANGGGFTGSALTAISALSARAMFNARAAAYRGATESQAHLYNAKVAKAAGVTSLISSLVPVAGAFYQGHAKVVADQRSLAMASQVPAGPDETAGLY